MMLLSQIVMPAQTWHSMLPLVTHPWLQLAVIVAAYTLCLTLSGHIVKMAVGDAPPDDPANTKDAGRVIGKCENIIIITLVLLGQFDGLGLVLAAKSISRIDAIKKHASYYLGGTLTNFCVSLVFGVLARLTIVGP